MTCVTRLTCPVSLFCFLRFSGASMRFPSALVLLASCVVPLVWCQNACNMWNGIPQECAVAICPLTNTPCVYLQDPTGGGICDCPTIDSPCSLAIDPKDCKKKFCNGVDGPRCQWYWNEGKGKCDCPTDPPTCREMRYRVDSGNNICGNNIAEIISDI